jgi:uncharacterized membrane protein
LPSVLKKQKRDIPYMSVVYTLFFSLIMANTIDLSEIAIIGSASFLLIFFIVNISAFKISKDINASKIITILSSIFSLLALVILLYHTYGSNPIAVFIFVCFIFISFLFELLYGKYVRGHIFHRRY